MLVFRAAAARAAALAAGLVVACAGAAGPAGAPAAPSGAVEASSPVPLPRPGVLGCVESRELKRYVLALEARRREARQAALAAHGVAEEQRRGAFGAAGAAALDQRYEAEGKRFVVASELAPHGEPRVPLARQGSVLRRIDERPRAHPVDVLVCGLERCPRQGREGERPRVAPRPLVIELEPAESWGGALALSYDYWWARVRYDRREPCRAGERGSAAGG